jgi:hypothetical protein
MKLLNFQRFTSPHSLSQTEAKTRILRGTTQYTVQPAVQANIGNVPAGGDDLLTYIEGVEDTDRFDGDIHAGSPGQFIDGVGGKTYI